MPVGLGARNSAADTSYVSGGATVTDMGGVRAPGGQIVQPFYGRPGMGTQDTTSQWVWIITVAAAVMVVGSHFLLSVPRRVLG